MRRLAGLAALTIGLSAAPAVAQGPEKPELIAELSRCRAIADDAERLRCLDRQAAALDAAWERRELVVVTRNDVRTARRSLFGLTLPSLDLFRKAERPDEEAEFTEIDAVIGAVSRDRDKWLLTLGDGARWMQSDDSILSSDPKAGDKVRIRKAAMGSFLANVAGRRAFRVRRVN